MTVAEQRALLTQGCVPRCPRHPSYTGARLPAVGRRCDACNALRAAVVKAGHEGRRLGD